MKRTISKLARTAGVSVETVRYYQRRGLMPQPPRVAGGVRSYGAADVERLAFIRGAQKVGFSLEEIGALLAADRTGDRAAARELAQGRLVALDATIAELTAARAGLARLAAACAASASDTPCPILEAFK